MKIVDVAVPSSTVCTPSPANLPSIAAMKSIVRRDTTESCIEYLKRLAEAAGLEATDEAALRRMGLETFFEKLLVHVGGAQIVEARHLRGIGGRGCPHFAWSRQKCRTLPDQSRRPRWELVEA